MATNEESARCGGDEESAAESDRSGLVALLAAGAPLEHWWLVKWRLAEMVAIVSIGNFPAECWAGDGRVPAAQSAAEEKRKRSEAKQICWG